MRRPPPTTSALIVLRERASPRKADFIEPCLPCPAKEPPVGHGWIHEIKHDGYRLMARRDDDGVRLLTRKGYSLAKRFPQVVAAITVLPVRSCLIDGEAVVCNEKRACRVRPDPRIPAGRHRRALRVRLDRAGRQGFAARADRGAQGHSGEALEPPPTRVSPLTSTIPATERSSSSRLVGLAARGIVSKRLRSFYHSGRADCWVMVKNSAAPAAKRAAEEKWN
jgi:bifunctional non-homologous end joining protein LigD